MNIIYGSRTDKGIKKPINQDRIINCIHTSGNHCLFLGGIFDGISSLKDSEYAAEYISDSFENWFAGIKGWIDLEHVDDEIICCHLLDVLEETALYIYDERQSGVRNGGTTASIILVIDCNYYIFHIGDSKVFLLRNQVVTQLTEDQKILGTVKGVTRYFLDNFIGKESECQYLKYYGILEEGDTILYGSDGFFNKLSSQELVLMNQEITDSKIATRVLEEYIEQVKAKGETDNISVGLFKCTRDVESHII